MTSGIEHELSESLLTTPSVLDMLEGSDAIQKDVDMLERWAYANVIKFSKAKCKTLHPDRGNLRHTHRMGREVIESSPTEKDLRVILYKNLT